MAYKYIYIYRYLMIFIYAYIYTQYKPPIGRSKFFGLISRTPGPPADSGDFARILWWSGFLKDPHDCLHNPHDWLHGKPVSKTGFSPGLKWHPFSWQMSDRLSRDGFDSQNPVKGGWFRPTFVSHISWQHCCGRIINTFRRNPCFVWRNSSAVFFGKSAGKINKKN